MLDKQAYALSVSRREVYCVVRAEGELDIGAVLHLCAAIETACGTAERVVLDLREVSFMDTYILRALVALQRDVMKTGQLHLVPGEGIQRVLDVTGLRGALHWMSAEQLAR
jgi:anti-anti-sigma factor